MNIFTKILTPGDVLLNVEVADKRALLEVAADRLARNHALQVGVVLRSLLEREKLGSTGLGQGVAIPHARVDGLSEPLALYIRPASPLSFDAPDRQPVTDVLVLLAPEHANRDHLRILAEAAQLFSDKRFREKLNACDDGVAVCKTFSG